MEYVKYLYITRHNIDKINVVENLLVFFPLICITLLLVKLKHTLL